MLQELSRTELRNLINRVTQYGSTALEGVPEMHILQVIHYLKYQINRIEVEANQLATAKADNNGDYNPQIHTSEYYANCYVDYDINKRLLSLVSNLGQPEPIQSEPKQPDNAEFDFKNNFNIEQPKEIYDHFKSGLVKPDYIKISDLHLFLKLAFEQNKPPTEKIKFTKSQYIRPIQNCFHTFFKESRHHKGKKAILYVNLLCDYFDGYEAKNVKTNWSK
jgi:hypothetical protein